MFKVRQLIKGGRLLLSGALLVLVIVFTEKKHTSKICQCVAITIANKTEQRFLEKSDLLKQVTINTKQPILGTPLQALETRHVAHIVKNHHFVREGIAYKNWKGALKIAILPRKVVARIIYPNQQEQYIDEDGTLLPLSNQYTARVPLVEVEQLQQDVDKKNLREYTYGTALLALLNYIDHDPFWRAQIVYMCINKKGKITMYTQISKQRIEFGTPEAAKKKLAKLMLFYKKIVPYKGWNTYKRVNIEFDNQIICE